MKIKIKGDRWNGWEVVARRWWWPFWCQYGGTNTHISREAAEEYADRVAGYAYKPKPIEN